MADTRTSTGRDPRDLQTRAESARIQAWKPIGSLPELPPNHRWVRISSMGQPDEQNFYKRQMAGWEPCPRDQYPELAKAIMARKGSQFEGYIEMGGLLACRRSPEMTRAEVDYINQQTDMQVRSVNKQTQLRQELGQDARVEVSSQTTIRGRDGSSSVVNG